jgi:hypothetical protein
MWNLFADAAGKVALWGLILGAGLPALFALGVRSTVLANGPADAEAAGVTTAVPSQANRLIGVVCFVLVVAIVALGIMVVVAAGLGKVVSFEHVFPTLVPKS